ncbi:unnamed protein product [Diamesa tonsa]
MRVIPHRLTKFSFIRQYVVHRQLSTEASFSNNKDKQNENKRNWSFLKKSTSTALVIGSGIIGYNFIKNNEYFSTLVPHVSAAKPFTGRRAQFNFIADVVEETKNSVCFIEIQDTRRVDYFSGKPVTVSNGSGFIVESNGLILTNAHVVINKPKCLVSVKLQDGRQFLGTVEAVDPVSDLATVRIPCKNLSAMRLGQSSTLRSGEWVVALGSPLGMSNTVTAGVVSSTQRPSQELGLKNTINYIQTDAAITFGNSGGPLVNLDGEAIGINSMKVTAGISFAIPIDYAREFLRKAEERVKGGVPSTEPATNRRYMGITMLTLTPDIIRELKQRGSQLPDNIQNGILVWKVILGSPAHQGGLLAGDIITQINGNNVSKSSDIYEILANKTKILQMVIIRGAVAMKIAVTPDDPE